MSAKRRELTVAGNLAWAGRVMRFMQTRRSGLEARAGGWDDCPVLRLGMRGAAVRRLQRGLHLRLTEFGSLVPAVPLTGQFDQATAASVRYLQCVAFLPVDGVVDLLTWDFLRRGVRSLPVLAPGSCGAMVWQVQDTLKRLGLVTRPGSDFGGSFGPALATQLRDYQRLTGLPELGIIEHRTWAALVQERARSPRWWLVLRPS